MITEPTLVSFGAVEFCIELVIFESARQGACKKWEVKMKRHIRVKFFKKIAIGFSVIINR